MGEAPEMTTYEADRGAVPEPVVVHVKSTATDMFGEESLCFVACNQKPSSVADSKCFGKACTVIENLNAGIIKTPVRLCFDSAKVFESFANSYNTALFKDIELVLSYYDTSTAKRLSALSKFCGLSRLQVFWNVFPESCALHRTEIEHQFASSVRAECAVAVTFQEWGITMVSKDYAKALDLPGLFNFAECSTNNDDRQFYHYHFPQSYPPHSRCCSGYLKRREGRWARHKELKMAYASLVAAQEDRPDVPSVQDILQQLGITVRN
ncbi:hypothetical protein MRS44_018161 [Fusarium solani]|uniref:uncharacterized protein n=1 Tax=Fusarium solani TaxID=169388 RepID=UPI0032C4AD4E|nr:hypothetical protein MRS44_018161 [Fusarium solani]